MQKDLEELNEAVKERKVVEKIKEKQFNVFKKEKNLESNKQQDEVAIRITQRAEG